MFDIRHSIHRSMVLLPILGMVLFVVFYLIAAMHYPGGSYAVPHQSGFSFQHNYLCDLLDTTAINGHINTARTYARMALGFLCFSLVLLWAYLPLLFEARSRVHWLISFFGIASMLTTVFLASEIHDVIVRIAGLFGVIALVLTFKQLYKSNYTKLLLVGIFSLILLLANYYIYETEILLEYLPFIQKLTFISCITWFIVLNILLIKKLSRSTV